MANIGVLYAPERDPLTDSSISTESKINAGIDALYRFTSVLDLWYLPIELSPSIGSSIGTDFEFILPKNTIIGKVFLQFEYPSEVNIPDYTAFCVDQIKLYEDNELITDISMDSWCRLYLSRNRQFIPSNGFLPQNSNSKNPYAFPLPFVTCFNKNHVIKTTSEFKFKLSTKQMYHISNLVNCKLKIIYMRGETLNQVDAMPHAYKHCFMEYSANDVLCADIKIPPQQGFLERISVRHIYSTHAHWPRVHHYEDSYMPNEHYQAYREKCSIQIGYTNGSIGESNCVNLFDEIGASKNGGHSPFLNSVIYDIVPDERSTHKALWLNDLDNLYVTMKFQNQMKILSLPCPISKVTVILEKLI